MDTYNFSILRDLRKNHAMTIADVANASGISTAVISKIERNQVVPELQTLSRLGKVFGTTVTDLLGLVELRSKQITHASQYISGEFQFQHINFNNMRCFIGTAIAGDTVSRPEVHHNDYETCWVLKGRIEIIIGGDSHILDAGAAIQFNALLKHSYKALEDCRILIIHLNKNAGM